MKTASGRAHESLLSMALLLYTVRPSLSITCYECQSGQGRDCKYTPKSCGYGFFGCVKIAVYSGGIDRFGNRFNEESKIVSMLRGCSIIPLGNVEICEQSAILGYRIVKCTCFNDYCNSSRMTCMSFSLVSMLCLVVFGFL